MKKGFNWGHGIAIFYVVFVGVLATALIASFGIDHSLVTDDYYQKDITFQNQIDKSANSLYHKKINIALDRRSNLINLEVRNASNVKGEVQFYRPSDIAQDFIVQLSEAHTTVPTDRMINGKWVIKMDIDADGIKYYHEEQIVL